MTRVLSELLGAPEARLRYGLLQLEKASGGPNEDIRLGVEVQQQVREALRDLHLDPKDTNGIELYQALQEQIRLGDQVVLELLQHNTVSSEAFENLKRLVSNLDIPKKVFAVKMSVAKKLVKNNPPKRTMRQLGYRSADSMLKHEPLPQLYAAATMCESAPWHKQLLNQYKQLLPSDFESRDVSVLVPSTHRWESLAGNFVRQARHNILSFKELGAVIVLPITESPVDGVMMADLVLSVQAINDIRYTSTYLKLHQVRPDFGELVSKAARHEPYTEASLLNGERLPWRLVQRYFARHGDNFVSELFEPHIQPEDLKTKSAESVLAGLHPRLSFWKGRAHAGLLDNGNPVSVNVTDALLNFCNKIPFEQRIVQHFRDQLWHELLLRYMQQGNLELTVRNQLTTELVDDPGIDVE